MNFDVLFNRCEHDAEVYKFLHNRNLHFDRPVSPDIHRRRVVGMTNEGVKGKLKAMSETQWDVDVLDEVEREDLVVDELR